MAQKISQGNIFGRLGTGFAQGLAEQVPKEIERNRLARGLESLNNDQNLDEFQRFSKLASVAHEYPQIVQSGGDILKKRALRNSFINNQGNNEQYTSQGKSSAQFSNENAQPMNYAPGTGPGNIKREVIQGQNLPSDFASREEQAAANPGLARENPAQEKFVPKVRWSQDQVDNAIGREAQRHPELSFDQIVQRVKEEESRALSSPEDYQKQLDYYKGLEDQADAELDKQLAISLEKNASELYPDISGDTLLNMRKAMYNDLATSTMDPKRVAEKWRLKAKDYVETKNLLKEKASRDLVDRLLPNKKEDVVKSLKSAQKIYDEMGNKRELYNMLRTKNDPARGIFGFDLSPGGAALISNPRSPPLQKIIKEAKGFNTHIGAGTVNSKKIAAEFIKHRTSNDSVLAFARSMKDSHPLFNETAFFDYMRDNEDTAGFTPDQKKEVTQGVSDITPNWGDLALFPLIGKSSAHD
jgi:hypothetical protein